MSGTKAKARVVVAMSGGVDSSVAAYLLARDGYDVVGVTMRLWASEAEEVTTDHQGCCSIEDIEDARRVCQTLGVPHYVLNVEREFREHVMDYFVDEYQKGRTPHPCIACNDRIKYDFLMRRAEMLDAQYVATGHYARIGCDDETGERMLLKGVDPTKDQSYVLFGLSELQLQRMLLPVGGYAKTRIRELAAEGGLHLADKRDSQEICFIPQGDYREFLKKRIEPKPGEMVHVDGRVLGTHKGIEFFTIGQRRGLGVAPNTPATERLFVAGVDAESGRVYLGPEEALYKRDVAINGVNYVGGNPPSTPMHVTAKIRYNGQDASAVLSPGAPGEAVLRFEEPQRAITPGQAAVFYEGDRVLGGGYVVSATTGPSAAAQR
jgi:tRNA-specific 2-thiouridylase